MKSTVGLSCTVVVLAKRRSLTIRSMPVDESTDWTWIDAAILDRVGVKRRDRKQTLSADDGGSIRRSTGLARLRLRGVEVLAEVVFAEPGDRARLGGLAFASLGILSNPALEKPLKRLRPADVERCPVWQHVNNWYREPHDESQRLRPRPEMKTIEYSDDFELRHNTTGLCVAARLAFADGSEHPGLFEPSMRFSWSVPPTSVRNAQRHGEVIFDMKPYVLTARGPMRLWQWDSVFSRRQMDRLYATLDRSADGVFPIRLSSCVPVSRGYFSKAVIPGFIARVDAVHTTK